MSLRSFWPFPQICNLKTKINPLFLWGGGGGGGGGEGSSPLREVDGGGGGG